MLDKNKTNPKLGQEVRDFLIKKGVETPISESTYTSEQQITDIKQHVKSIMDILGLDLNDDSLQDTPARVAKMYVNEIMWGLKTENFPKCMVVDNKFHYDEFVIEKDISVMSLCEHHLVTIVGKAVVAYKPDTKVLGLSKLNRIVEYFSRRPQVQERLTEQIFYALSYILGTEDIAVIIEADHFCVKTRGVEDSNASTVTSKLDGCFRQSAARAELMALMR